MIPYTGNALKKYCERINRNFLRRDCFDQLEQYLNNDDNRVCCLYGLRRTGKTVLQAQAIQNLNNYDDCLLLYCQKDDDVHSVCRFLNSHRDKHFIFVDEATNLSNFITLCSVFADYYVVMGQRVILSGTDSLGIKIALSDELFGRANLISTTYISYKEYNHLLNRDLHNYMAYGGVLTNGAEFQEAENCKQYANISIINNIQHSLENWNNGNNFDALKDIYYRNEFNTYVHKILDRLNYAFVAKVVKEKFSFRVLQNLHDGMYSVFNNPNQFVEEREKFDPYRLGFAKMKQNILSVLKIKSDLREYPNQRAMEQVLAYLKALDVIYVHEQTKNVYFTQPGMRYSQVDAVMQSLYADETFSSYSADVQNKIQDTLRNQAEGQMIEDIVFYHCLRDNNISKRYSINKFRDDNTFAEFDMVLWDRKEHSIILLEIKHTDKQKHNALRHLKNPDTCALVEKEYGSRIIGKAVLYMGETDNIGTQEVLYMSVHDFLVDMESSLEKIKQNYREIG